MEGIFYALRYVPNKETVSDSCLFLFFFFFCDGVEYYLTWSRFYVDGFFIFCYRLWPTWKDTVRGGFQVASYESLWTDQGNFVLSNLSLLVSFISFFLFWQLVVSKSSIMSYLMEKGLKKIRWIKLYFWNELAFSKTDFNSVYSRFN